ncbi:MAG: hypothetical protein LAN84_17050 [Acidobacteriia bacterium]|nr:hypothetical protein [Terriglobia bacterium]
MAKATITTDKGLKVVVEGSQEEVQNIVRQLGGGSGHGKKPSRQVEKTGKRLPSATDAILELKEEGFFDKPKALAEVKDKLASQGMIYPLTSLSGVVLGLVRRRRLGRVKEDGRWSYVSR